MENVKETYNKSNQTHNANNPSHYKLLTLGIVVIMAGALLRFAADSLVLDMVSNLILVVGVALGLKSVYNILQ